MASTAVTTPAASHARTAGRHPVPAHTAMTPSSAVVASAAAATVPMTTPPGTIERARQDSSAPHITATTVVPTGLARSVMTNAATSNPADRCATNQDVVAASA